MIQLRYQYRCSACGRVETQTYEISMPRGLAGVETPAPALPRGWRVALERLYCPEHRLRLVVSGHREPELLEAA